MTATTNATANPEPSWRTSMPGARVTQARVLLSEWTKFRTLRSTHVTTLLTVVFTVGIGLLVCGVQANRWPHASLRDKATFNPVFTSLVGVQFAQLVVGVLGVLLFSGEYGTGMIRATMSAVATRLPVLWAKLAVFTVVVAVLSIISAFAAFLGGQALLSSRGIQASLSDPGVTREVIGSALYLVVIGILAVALGAIVRSTAGAISTLVGLLFVLPPILNVLPTSWQDNIGPYLPSNAGDALWARPEGAHLAAWTGFGVMCAWAAAAIIVAAVLLVRRDA